MISYCIAVYRPAYAAQLLTDLVDKTTAPCEILLWLNVDSPPFEAELARAAAAGAPVRVLGRTPDNIGMQAYRALFQAARFPLIVQIDDDVVCVSRGIAERAMAVFQRHPAVRQLVADVWQDEFTTGARPPLAHYRAYGNEAGLYQGPIDGWFSVYHRSILPLLLSLPYSPYLPIGGLVRNRLAQSRQHGLLDRAMQVFHVIGPEYAHGFGMLDFEIQKYRRLGRHDIVGWYEGWRDRPDRAAPPAGRVDEIRAALGRLDGRDARSAAGR